MLKAIGFADRSLAIWQTLRIGIVLFLAAVISAALSTPLSQVCVGPAFQMMGAQSITFQVKPLEVYVLYPLLVFAVTITSSMLTARQIRRIAASEASNAE